MAKSRYRNKQKQNFKKNMTGLVKCFSPGARLKLSNQWRAIMSMGREWLWYAINQIIKVLCCRKSENSQTVSRKFKSKKNLANAYDTVKRAKPRKRCYVCGQHGRKGEISMKALVGLWSWLTLRQGCRARAQARLHGRSLKFGFWFHRHSS